MRFKTRLVVVGAIATLAIAIGAGNASAVISTYTVNPKATLSADGTVVTLTGTITCDFGDSIFNFFQVTEVVGRTIRQAQASFFFPPWLICAGASQSWSQSLFTFGTLPFLPGRAELHTIPFDDTDFTGGPNVNEPIVLVP